MSTKRPPLLSDDGITKVVPIEADFYDCELTANRVREVYETARAKDAELIQMAVDMAYERVIGVREKMRELVYKKETLLLAMAAEAGFKPTEQ